MKRSIKDDFNMISILLIPIGVAINFTGFWLVSILRLPIWLDTIGTILVGILAGPWVAICTGLTMNLVAGVFNPTMIPYAITSMAIGMVAGFMASKGLFKTPIKTIICGVAITLTATIVSAPITVLVFGGSTGGTSSILTAVFLTAGQNIWTAVFSSAFILEITDKILSCFVAFLIVKRMSERYLAKMNNGHIYMHETKAQ